MQVAMQAGDAPERRPAWWCSQKAEALAFGALIESKLEPATAYTTWCEWESYTRHTRAAFGAGLPLPLSYWLPWTQRRAALRRVGSASRDQVPLLSVCFAPK